MAPIALASSKEHASVPPLSTVAPLGHYAPAGACKVGPRVAQKMIADALEERVQAIDGDTCEAGEEDAFFVADMGEVYRQHLRWKSNLARVKPHYGE